MKKNNTKTNATVNEATVLEFINNIVDVDTRVFEADQNKKTGYYLKAYCSLKLDCGLILTGCKLMCNAETNECFFSFPSNKGADGNYYPIIYLDGDDFTKDEKQAISKAITQLIVEKYKLIVEKYI